MRKWVTKNSAESENMNWILANTKPCPKCKRPIEKNQVGHARSTRWARECIRAPLCSAFIIAFIIAFLLDLQGCMHMTCSQCRHEFCWLCNGDWKEHGERTGGFYACNR